MNFGREFPNAQRNGIVQNGDSWFMVTPENPVPVRSNPVLVEMQGNQMGRGNWQDLLGMYSDLLQQSTNDGAVQTSNPPIVGANGGNLNRNGRIEAEKNQHLNQNFESNLQNFWNCSTASRSNNHLAELLGCQNAEILASANGTPNKRIIVPNRATNSNAYTQAASSWMEPPESNSLMLAKQSCISGSNQRLTNSNSYTRVTTNWTAPESNSLMFAKQNFTFGSNQRLTNLNSYSQMASNWTEPESTTSLMPEKQNFTLGSSQRHIDPSFTQVPDAGFTVPYWPNYNLSSPPRPEPDAALHRSSSFHFAPVTPDQAKQLEHQRVSLDESSSQEKDKQWNVVTISMSPEIEKRSNEFSQIVLDSASATPLKEKNVISHEEAEQGIDLNKTPEQKMPRRRKHRPKVVIEGKPKRVRKAVNPKTNVSGENPSGKRKYVRKKGLEIPESQQGNIVNEVTLTEVESSQKYCRRALNFDLETGVRNASHDIPDSHQAGRHREGSGKSKYEREKSLKITESQQDNVANEDTTPIVESSQNSCRRSLNFDLETRASYKSHDRTDSQRAGKSHENKWPFNLNLNSMDTELCTEKNQQNVSTCNLTCPTNQRSSEYILLNDQRTPPTTPPAKAKDHLNLIARNVQMRKSVAGHSSWISGCNQVHQADSSLSPNFHSARQLMLQSANQLVVKDMENFNEKRGLKRAHCHIVDQIHPRTQNLMGSSILSQKCSTVGPIASETCKKMSTGSGQVGTGGLHGIYANNATSQINAINGTSGNWCIAPKATKQNFERQQDSFTGRAHRGLMAQKVYQSTQAHDLNSLTAVTSWKLVSTPLEAPTTSQYQQRIKTGIPNVSTKKKKVKPVSLNQGSRRTEIVLHQQQSHAFEDHRQYPMRARGQLRKQKLSALIEEITYWLEGLNINCTNNEVVAQEQHALVPYKGSSTIVPFEGFDHIKKRKPRPKVDLDPETDRIWKLLMGIEGSESAETTDKDKEKWWEEERKVFRGRADSFIARMHLVQGDRRFSRWKGSVVDSVIGVFLTQNVSDHLSSSAFMCLAARFPLQSTITTTCYQDGSVLVEEPDIPVLESDSSMNHQEEAGIKNSASEYDRILAEFDLSQNSFGPLKYRRTGYSPEKDFYTRVNGSSLLDVGSTRWHHQSEDPRLGRVNNNLRGSSAFPYPLNSQILHMREPILSSRTDSGVNNMGGRMREIAESQIPAQLNGVLSDQAPPVVEPFPFLGKHRTQQGYLEPERSKTYNPERTAATEPIGPIRGETKGISGTSVSNSRKGKAEGENKSTIDWDSLRKEAQSNGKRERSKEAMDSLDYEAVRLANVNEISNAIKERGMNNMLADRIKNFLNRLVTDHGSIDLEWLRDVPPDKAKDYLLSIRGLGLKSVECVRLLTLHQLAFPVDTNVGRIAVRLGWVPLQPLPESLQLHLLELYPILESIQKYIWPRLCKLDQQTLYELHYQMITFGKVFCTKSKPNCNACPMRGECRHFASAFASARLALPGPEEKSLVSSAVPVAPDNCNNPVASMRPMPLLQAEKDQKKEAWSINKKCEPIVEEPSTPEQEITAELLESDIEDVFYEDPDEIPTIKLNIEEFTLNLQNYMQDNMELQEGDMSRALVALNPEVASIPTPKLKNVSRLRTEHQVYELPDNHPLLEGMDKREPDDPSPYLLAIWTPGETANSVQPPESRCEIHESGQLCNDQTCFSCNSTREANSQIVRGTLLIPCRTAMRGSFPLNGTYFQVNEMFADHASSLNPISVPRSLIWNLNRRTVYFGTSVSSIFKGLPTEGIQFCFWKGFVCVRGFDQKRRCPRPLMARLHFPASKLVKTKKSEENSKA